MAILATLVDHVFNEPGEPIVSPAIADSVAWLAWIVVVVVGIALLLFDRNSRYFWVSPLRWFALGYFAFYVLPALNILYFNHMPFILYREEKFVSMSLAVALGGISFLVGWRSKRDKSVQAAHTDQQLTVQPKIMGVQMILLAVVVLMSVLVVINYFGGLTTFFTSGTTVFEQIGSTFFNIYSLLFAAFVPLLVLMLLVVLRLHGLQRIAFFLALLVIFLAYFLISVKLGSRYRFLFVLVPSFAMYLAVFRVRRIGWRLAVLLGAFALFAFILGNIRFQFSFIPSEVSSRVIDVFQPAPESLYEQVMLHGDFDAFENGMELMTLVPAYRSPMWGSTLLSVLYNPIPRFLWPGKPSPSASQYMVELGLGPATYGHINFAVSLIAELYVNFWWAGVIGGMFILGIVSGWLWNWFLANSIRPEAWFHIGLFGAYLFIVTRGSFHAMTIYYLMAVVNEVFARRAAVFITADVLRRRSRRNRFNPSPRNHDRQLSKETP